MSLVLTDVQKVALSVKPLSAAGNPAPVDGKLEWTSSAPDVLGLEVAEDGFSALAVTTGKLGVAQVSVKGDADLGDGVVEITGVLSVEVKASQAVTLGVDAGVPENK